MLMLSTDTKGIVLRAIAQVHLAALASRRASCRSSCVACFGRPLAERRLRERVVSIVSGCVLTIVAWTYVGCLQSTF